MTRYEYRNGAIVEVDENTGFINSTTANQCLSKTIYRINELKSKGFSEKEIRTILRSEVEE